ncbi:MAG TPA: hypothetical protein VK915_04125, partial [Gaiellaceae bacterium]|nr:hypothetical protein [Gaiellaceae bacterium]
ELSRTAGRERAGLPERARRALRDAGDRALSLNAYAPAVRFYREALGSWPEGDPGRPRLLLRYGQALYRAEAAGADVLAEAAAELLDAGELELAAEAEVLLADLLLHREGGREQVDAHLAHAVSLLADRPASRSKAHVLAERARFHLTADEAASAVACADEGLRMAEDLGLEDLRAHALSTRGFARVMTGDLDGLHDLEESVAIASGANSPQAARGFNNLASMHADLGDLARAFELYAESRRVAERFGDAPALRWLEVERMYERYWVGDWDAALEAGGRLLAEGGPQPTSLQELDIFLIRAKIALAREGAGAARADADRAADLARATGAPQILFPTLAFRAHALTEEGDADAAASCADELLGLWLDEGAGVTLASFWLADLAFALAGLGRGGELEEAAGRPPTATRWLEASAAIGHGDWQGAAALFARIGSLPDEALARLRAGEGLVGARRSAEAEEDLRAARAFYERVAAPASVRAAESVTTRMSPPRA